jgi:hypothetical protein
MSTGSSRHSDNLPKGLPLSDVVAGSTVWERTIVPIGGSARVLALVATPALLAVTLTVLVWPAPSAAAQHPGFFLFGWPWVVGLLQVAHRFVPGDLVTSVLLLAICLLTAGFREAGRRVQLTFGVVLASALVALAVPALLLAIAVANLAIWILLGVLIVAAVITVIAALCSSL